MKEFFYQLWDTISNFFVRTWNSVAPFFKGFKLPGFATMILGITFIFLLVIVIMGIKKIRRINKGELVYSEAELIDTEEARKPLFKLQKKDYIIMLVMCALYSIPALYNLGSFEVPSTGWAPAAAMMDLLLIWARKQKYLNLCFIKDIMQRDMMTQNLK